jgi:hypothetical protein
MKIPLVIALTAVVLVAGSALAIMNKACKSSYHPWCSPVSSIGTTQRLAVASISVCVDSCVILRRIMIIGALNVWTTVKRDS